MKLTKSYNELKEDGLDDTTIASKLKMDIFELRQKLYREKLEFRIDLKNKIEAVRDEGLTAVEIANLFGLKESTIHTILKEDYIYDQRRR